MNAKHKKDLVIKTAAVIIVILAVAALKIAGEDILAAFLAGAGTGALAGISLYKKMRCTI